MSIEATEFPIRRLHTEPSIRIWIEGEESIKHFKTLLNRALNTWDDAPPELKALADTIIYGQQLQDYNNLPR